MLVASGAEFGDACMAALGQLPQVIGNIRTAIGCGTVRRASGIAVQVTVGDPVYQGDVIETSADGRIEIRFIDGTVFNLSRDARVELSVAAADVLANFAKGSDQTGPAPLPSSIRSSCCSPSILFRMTPRTRKIRFLR